MTTLAPNDRQRQGGMTLVEISFVLLLVAVMSGLVGPRLWHSLAADPLETASRRLIGLVRQAGDTALQRQRSCRLRVEGTTRVVLEESSVIATIAEYEIPSGLRLTVAASAGGLAGSTAMVLFSPHGYAQSAVLQLADRRGRRLDLIVEPLLCSVSLRRP